jgi:hypothetical protein
MTMTGLNGEQVGRSVSRRGLQVAVPQQMFTEILSLIARLRAPPAPA